MAGSLQESSPWGEPTAPTSTAPSSYVSGICRKTVGALLPFVPGLALALLDGVLEARTTSQQIALVAGFVGLFLGIAWWNAHTARKFQNEIDALDAS
jgi:hypothetical protein